MKLFAALLSLTPAVAQLTGYLAEPTVIWQGAISPQRDGNACTYSPTALLVCTSGNGAITAFNPKVADPSTAVWGYTPPAVGTGFNAMESTSGVSFGSSEAFGSFGVYGTTDRLDDGTNICRVHGISLADGSLLWTSENLAGACSGTPVIALDGSYLYVTANEEAQGTFSILSGADGSTFFQETDTEQLLSPPGIYHSPIRGGYAGGESNRNDMVVWGNRPVANIVGVPNNSKAYGFQFPVGFSGALNDVNVITLIDNTDFQADAPPLLTTFGTSMFWGVSRNAVVGWPSRAFNRSPGGNKVSYSPRGNPASRPVIAQPASTRNPATEQVLFTGSASNHFGAIDFGIGSDGFEQIQEKWTLTTGSPVFATPQVSPEDSFVYFVEENGVMRQIHATNGTIVWEMAVQGFVRASAFAQSFDGDEIYFADTNGIVHAWQVGVLDAGAPTNAPIVAAPTSPPVAGTAAPIVPVTAAPVTTAPVLPGTAAPVVPLPSMSDIIAAQVPPLNTLAQLVAAINATTVFSDPNADITVFAPSDEAFTASFPETHLVSYIEDLSTKVEWYHHTACYIGHHIGNFTRTTDMWEEGEVVESVDDDLLLTLGVTPGPSVNGIPVAGADNVASNGVVQLLNEGTIMNDCVSTNIYAAGQADENFSILVSLVAKTGIAKALSEQRPLTLFAPTNAAFEALPADVLAFLTDDANTNDLRDVLFYHLVRQNIYLDDGTMDAQYTTTSTQPINITKGIGEDADDFFVNGIGIEIDNIIVQNGIIHAIESVLIPPGLALPSAAPISAPPVVPSTVVPATTAPIGGATAAPITTAPIGGVTDAPVTMPPVATTDAPVTTAPVVGTAAPVTTLPTVVITASPNTPAPVTPEPTPVPTPSPTSAPTPPPVTTPPTSSAASSGMFALVATMVVGFLVM